MRVLLVAKGEDKAIIGSIIRKLVKLRPGPYLEILYDVSYEDLQRILENDIFDIIIFTESLEETAGALSRYYRILAAKRAKIICLGRPSDPKDIIYCHQRSLTYMIKSFS